MDTMRHRFEIHGEKRDVLVLHTKESVDKFYAALVNLPPELLEKSEDPMVQIALKMIKGGLANHEITCKIEGVERVRVHSRYTLVFDLGEMFVDEIDRIKQDIVDACLLNVESL